MEYATRTKEWRDFLQDFASKAPVLYGILMQSNIYFIADGP